MLKIASIKKLASTKSTLWLCLILSFVWIIFLHVQLNTERSSNKNQNYHSNADHLKQRQRINTRVNGTTATQEEFSSNQNRQSHNAFSTKEKDEFTEKQFDEITQKHIEIDLIIEDLKPRLTAEYKPLFHKLGLPPEVQTALIRQRVEMERRKQEILLSQESLAILQNSYDRHLKEGLSDLDYQSYRDHEHEKASTESINQLAENWEEHFSEPLSTSARRALSNVLSEIGNSNLVDELGGPYAPPPRLSSEVALSGSITQEHLVIDRLSLLQGDLNYIKENFSNSPILTGLESLYSVKIAELEQNIEE